MRRRLSGDGPRPLRPVDPPRRAAGALRRVARWHQGAQHHAGGGGARHGHPGLASQLRAPPQISLPDDRALELQPLRGAGGVPWQPCLHQRPGRGAAHPHPGRFRRRVLRRVPPLRARSRVSHRRPEAERARWSVLPARPRARTALLRHPGHAGADRSRPRPADPHQGLRGRCTDPAQRRVDDPVADRHGARRVPARGAHLAPARVSRAHGDQARGRRHHALLHAPVHPADGVLPPALRRRHLRPGDVERPGCADDLRRAGHRRGRHAHHGRLRRGHARLRRGPGACGVRDGLAQRGGVAGGCAGARGRQPPPAQGAGQGGHHHRSAV